MFRRIPSAPAFFWILALTFVAVPLTLGLVSQAAQAGQVEDDPGLETYRPTIDDPEVGVPGDDDQPTITPRKRGNVGAMAPAPVDPVSSGTASQPSAARLAIERLVESIQRCVGRLGSMLRSPS